MATNQRPAQRPTSIEVGLLKERAKRSASVLTEVPSRNLLPQFIPVFRHHLLIGKIPVSPDEDTPDAVQCFIEIYRGIQTEEDRKCLLPLWPNFHAWSIYLLSHERHTYPSYAVRLIDKLFFGTYAGFRQLITDSIDLGPLIYRSWKSRHPCAVEETRLLYLFLPKNKPSNLKSEVARNPVLKAIHQDSSEYVRLCMLSVIEHACQTPIDPHAFSDNFALVRSGCIESTILLQKFIDNDVLGWTFYALRQFIDLAGREPVFRWNLSDDISKTPGLTIWALLSFIEDRLRSNLTIPVAAKLLDLHILEWIVKLARFTADGDSNGMLSSRTRTVMISIMDAYRCLACYRTLLWRIRRSIKVVERRTASIPSWLSEPWSRLKGAADFYTSIKVQHDEREGRSHCSYSECTNTLRAAAHPFATCSGCRNVDYCSSECQSLDWGNHKKLCLEIRTEGLEFMRICSRDYDMFAFIAKQAIGKNYRKRETMLQDIHEPEGRDFWNIPIDTVTIALPPQTDVVRMSELRTMFPKNGITHRISEIKNLIRRYGVGRVRVISLCAPPYAEWHWHDDRKWRLEFVVQ
ncbi:uncharacterized protein ARMOST_17360 [Armillaria ostoyae]|uniref:MYND-type domain-containing protein n=1 Tax=Armillaria ostoyae TaxID=47428 RepID=A0A284RYX0_ARMOS|nr:uncharacterized protein ARMOST_17360 [Armillaria ostoyae]